MVALRLSSQVRSCGLLLIDYYVNVDSSMGSCFI